MLTADLTSLAVAGCTVLLLSACTDSDSPHLPPANSGPLTALLDAGGNSVHRPAEAGNTWVVSFGSLLVCSAEPVTIDRVVPRIKAGRAIDVSFQVRRVPAADEREGPPIVWAPLGTATDTPERLAERGELMSSERGPALGSRIDQPCDEDPDAPFTEILTTVTTDDSGVWVDRIDVDYVADGTTFTLPVDWSYVACGSAIDDVEVC